MKKILLILLITVIFGCSKDDDKKGTLNTDEIDCYICNMSLNGQNANTRTCETVQGIEDFKQRMRDEGFTVYRCRIDK